MIILEKIKKEIINSVNKRLNTGLNTETLVYPPDSKQGDLSLPLFSLVKKLQKSPEEIGQLLLEKPNFGKAIVDFRLIGPYFNFFIDKKYLAKNAIKEIKKEKKQYGNNRNLKGKKIMIEFAHPNPFKSFHIGHLRNILIGESLVRILEAAGAKIIRTNYQGDVGMHIAKCLWSFSKVEEKNYPKNTDEKTALLGKCYAAGAKAFEEDEKAKKEIEEINKKIYSGNDEKINRLWSLGKKWSWEKFHEIYKRVYSRFDREYLESEMIKDAYKYLEEAEKKGILESSEGAIIFNGNLYNLETRVFLNSVGLPTYDGKELALAYREFSDFGKLDLCIHNVAVEQIGYFKTNFKVQELLDEKKFKGKQYHNAYEFVGLKKGKMSSRKGNVILGNDILNEANKRIAEIVEKRENKIDKETIEKIAVAAIKYSFLKINPSKYLAFDMEESVNFSGDSGPYLQYTYTRIKSIFKKIENYKPKIKNIDFGKLNEIKEIELIKKISIYPETVERAGKNYDPSEIAGFLFELARDFNNYYHEVPILQSEEETKKARLALLGAIVQIIENGFYLLGIKTVEKM